MVLLLPVQEIWPCDRPRLAFLVSLGHKDQTVRLGIGKRLQQDRVDHAENRGVRSNSERQRNYRDDGKATIVPQVTQAELEVLKHKEGGATAGPKKPSKYKG